VHQYWCRTCREIFFPPSFEYHMFYVLYPFVTCLLILPRICTQSSVVEICTYLVYRTFQVAYFVSCIMHCFTSADLNALSQRRKDFFRSEVPENIHINYIILLNYDYKFQLPNFAQSDRDTIFFTEEKYKGTRHSLRSNCMRGCLEVKG
jgi:hypothetical protein